MAQLCDDFMFFPSESKYMIDFVEYLSNGINNIKNFHVGICNSFRDKHISNIGPRMNMVPRYFSGLQQTCSSRTTHPNLI